MKTRPILFSTDMVRAILAGKKTQTRRVVKDESLLDLFSEWPDLAPHMGTSIEDGTFGFEHVEYGAMCGEEHLLEPKGMAWQEVKCPYGVVGDRLWVREGYRQELNLGHDKDGNWPDAKSMYSYFYKADCDNPKGWGIGVWKSPMFMPRAASRIELEITGIRVERVQDISEQDAIAEGSYLTRCPCPQMQAKPRSAIDAMFKQTHCHIHGVEYSRLWDQINGKKHPWSENPWVWVVEFKRVENSHD